MSTPVETRDPRITFRTTDEIRSRFLEFFAERGHTVVPSASLVPAGDQTLLFTNSGMVQFKEVFTGAETRSYNRAVDYQRVLRVAGKHNDFEEVGRTTRHHTFFEMLGNWSFGDYFKREAIHFAWDFLTRNLGIPGERLAATTYTDDDVAWNVWRDEIGLPAGTHGEVGQRRHRVTTRTSGAWPTPDRAVPAARFTSIAGAHLSEGPHCIPDHSENCPRWLEIWNLVFMEFDQRPDERVPLPFPSVDTGMSLERLASRGPAGALELRHRPVPADPRGGCATLVGHDPDAFETERFSYQVIADHSRAMTFLVADGVLPANEGRGYVLRRIVRRAVRHGRLLGRREPFLAETADVVIDVMAGAYPHLAERRDTILSAIVREEIQFAPDAGRRHDPPRRGAHSADRARNAMIGRRAETLPDDAPVLDGAIAFRLHDTYGFPIDLTVELAAEYGVRVDRLGFEEALAEQRQRSRTGRKAELTQHAERTALYESIVRRAGDTEFLGYETTAAEGRVVAIIRDGTEYSELTGSGEAEVILDQTPFYPEGGGQIGDQGEILEAGGGSHLFTVTDTQRPSGGLIVHRGQLHGRIRVGETVLAEVDPDRRARTMRNHTGTHLLHRALRNVVGDAARQAGSRVGPEDLRFDFPLDRALTDEEKREIESEVRRIVREDRPVIVSFMTMPEAIEAGADAFFDEKYGERVRTVRVDGYSHELCGGTHCRASGQIGNFFILGERSIGSGIRRIEAVTGEAADALIDARLDELERIGALVGAQTLAAIPERVAMLQDELRETKRRLKAGSGGGVPRPADLAKAVTEAAPGVRLVAFAGPFESIDTMKSAAKDLRGLLGSGVIALGLDADEPQLFVTVSDDLVDRGVSAGALVQELAAAIGGRGGGRPAMAQAKGTRREGLAAALDGIREGLRATTTDAPEATG